MIFIRDNFLMNLIIIEFTIYNFLTLSYSNF